MQHVLAAGVKRCAPSFWVLQGVLREFSEPAREPRAHNARLGCAVEATKLSRMRARSAAQDAKTYWRCFNSHSESIDAIVA
jgi:hypothetical protein